MKGSDRLRYKEKKQRFRKAGFLAFLLAFLVMVAGSLFGESGILANLGVQNEMGRLLAEKQKLERENKRLLDEIRELKTSERKIEEIGRRDFGFGRPGEIVFYFPETKDEPIQRYREPLESVTNP